MYDIIIIGSGPAGLSAAIYAARAELSSIIIEKDYFGTGQIAVSEQVDNYLGIPEIGGYELGEKFREHALKFGAKIHEGEVCEITRTEGAYAVRLTDGNSVVGRCIIYAAGTSYRRLNISGGKLLGVSYCAVCDGMFYKDKEVAVIGGGDTALGDAVYLSKIAKKVYLIHRRENFRANRSLQEKIKTIDNIEAFMNSVPERIIGKERVEALDLLQNGIPKRLNVSGIFAAIGNIPNTSILEGICELDKNGYVIAGEDGITSAAGIFAAGDVRTKRLRQVVTAVSDGACCVDSAEEYLR
ncbi:MAG: FAD-dependent oxidoreductase [Ruminococcus sp.]|nr:FAD-dependent oxidoreductase [Ruminococcus sp.]